MRSTVDPRGVRSREAPVATALEAVVMPPGEASIPEAVPPPVLGVESSRYADWRLGRAAAQEEVVARA